MEAKSSTEVCSTRLASELYDRSSLEVHAAQLIEGHQRIEHDAWVDEPEINARTALFEELTAKGHLSHIEFDEPPEVTHQRTLQRLLNGWSDNLPDQEKERRFNEIVEELIVNAVACDIAAGRLPADTMVATISNIPGYENEEEAMLLTNLGYRTLNNKGMVRVTSFQNGHRVIEQISRSNSDDESSTRFFMANGFVIGSDPTRILASQLVVTRQEFPDGVIDVQRALDSMAGPSVRYGENCADPDANMPSYDILRAVSRDREEQAEAFIGLLADYEREVNQRYHAGLISYQDKLRAINRRRREIVDEICLLDPTYAEDARGEVSADLFKQAAIAMAAGDNSSAQSYFAEAVAQADPRAGVVCGGEGVAPTKAEEQDIASMYKEALEMRAKWQWKKGLCIVDVCPSRPAKVEVGPCSVCRDCQNIYDRGDKPEQVYRAVGFLQCIVAAVTTSDKQSQLKKAA